MKNAIIWRSFNVQARNNPRKFYKISGEHREFEEDALDRISLANELDKISILNRNLLNIGDSQPIYSVIIENLVDTP